MRHALGLGERYDTHLHAELVHEEGAEVEARIEVLRERIRTATEQELRHAKVTPLSLLQTGLWAALVCMCVWCVVCVRWGGGGGS